jgi:TolB protein
MISLSLLVTVTLAAQPAVIEISGANFRPMPLALPAATANDPLARSKLSEFDAALQYDLAACGLFTLLDRKSFLANSKEGLTAGTITFSNWVNVGAEALAKTQLTSSGNMLRGELRLFSVATGREELKYSLQLAPNEPRRIAHALANAVYKHFTKETGPFETKISFSRKTSGGKDIYLAGWDGQGAQVVASGGINLLPAVAPDGQTVAFTTYRRGKPEIFAARPGGQATAVVSAGRMATGVAYSPNGKQIAYSLADGESAQLYVANADGSNARQLTNTPYFINSSPTWSPDNARIAFVSNRGGSPQIYVMDAAGGEAKRLTFKGNYNQTPDWSPRGDLIVFTARDERNAFDLFTVNVENGKVTRLTQDQQNNEEPSFSPNGRLILFASTRNGGSQLFVMTADGNNQMALPTDKGTYGTPDWGP